MALDHDLHIQALYEVNHCDTLVHYTKYDISLQDIKGKGTQKYK